MAKLKHGILGPLIGKIANMVGYERMGVPSIKIKKKKTKKKAVRSDAQKAVNLRFKIAKGFASDVDEFISVGYQLDVAGTTRIPENAATSQLINEAMIGVYPEIKLDYSKVKLSKGQLPAPVNAAVKLENGILKFTWDVDPDCDYKLNRDQVMLLAYKPANRNSNFLLSGARRNEGAEELKVSIRATNQGSSHKDEFIEVYMAFISDDRKSISDSVYVGRVTV
jgi:hypothetical protein